MVRREYALQHGHSIIDISMYEVLLFGFSLIFCWLWLLCACCQIVRLRALYRQRKEFEPRCAQIFFACASCLFWRHSLRSTPRRLAWMVLVHCKFPRSSLRTHLLHHLLHRLLPASVIRLFYRLQLAVVVILLLVVVVRIAPIASTMVKLSMIATRSSNTCDAVLLEGFVVLHQPL